MKFRTMVASIALLVSFSGMFGLGKKPDPDETLLKQLKKAGSDLSKPHKLEFYLYFPTQSAATEVAATIKSAGFETEVKPAGTGRSWLCYATKTMVPELKALQKARHDFTAIATAKGGQYDGWGTEVVE